MGQAASLTHDRFIMRILHDEIKRPLDGSDVSTPRGETAKAEVQRLRGMIASRKLGEEAAEELKKDFDDYDADGSGEIDVHELGALIRQLGLYRTKEQLDTMVCKVDEDGSGEIDFPEFCEMLGIKISGPEDLEDIEIGYDKPYGTVMFSQQEDRFFYKEGDIDDLVIIAAAKAKERAAEEAAETRRTMFKKAFDEFDEDGSGEIDLKELATLVNELGLHRSDEELKTLMSAVDEDASGEVGFEEFVEMMEQMMKEDASGDMMAVMDGSKKAEMELLQQRERDSGALIMWK